MADLGAVGRDAEIVAVPISLLDYAAKARFTKGVEGVITNDASAVTARTIRLYSRANGRLLCEVVSNAGTGKFSVDVSDEEVQRVVLDDTAGTLYNDLIDRVLPGLIHRTAGALTAQSASVSGTATRV